MRFILTQNESSQISGLFIQNVRSLHNVMFLCCFIAVRFMNYLGYSIMFLFPSTSDKCLKTERMLILI